MDKKYIVIGGQYMQRVYGLANTLQGAKRIASKNREYWDNWQGWHTPKIYALSDCYQEEGQWYHYLWAML